MEIDSSTYIVGGLLILVVSFYIFYLIIHSAVKNATNDIKTSLSNTQRFLIMKLRKEGYSKAELMQIFSLNTDQFWASIPEDSTEPKS
jgi:hypothetical protein